MFRTISILMATFLAILTTSACGGGDDSGGGGGSVQTPPSPVSIVTTSLSQGTQGQSYSAMITSSGGTGTGHAWTITSGSLPTGVALSPTGTPGATLSGVPTVSGTFNFTVEVTDSGNFTASQPLTLDVAAAPALTITTTSLPNAQQAVSYSQMITATGGSGSNYSWAVISGALPTGLSLNPTGTPSATLSGISTVTGTFNFTLEVTDSIALTATQALQLVVDPAPPLSITTTSLPNGTQGVAYSETISASGGSGSGYTWSIVSGALPAGVTLTALGTPDTTLSGTPTGSGTFNFTVQVEDSLAITATMAYQIDITANPLTITSTPDMADGTEGTGYSEQITGSGGNPGNYAWSVTWGELPPGLVLTQGSPSATLAGTPTSFGRWHFTMELSDGASTTTLDMNVIVIVTATSDSWVANFGLATDRVGTSVFTGSKIIQFGGETTATNAGEIMEPGAGTWVSTSSTNAPAARVEHTAVWTGRVMLVFGGRDGSSYFNDLYSLDPFTNTWTDITAIHGLKARAAHSAVWTGTEMIIFGGRDDTFAKLNDGAAYNPATNTWRGIATVPAGFGGRDNHIAEWTDAEMVIWGGDGSSGLLFDGAAYDPLANTWASMSNTNAPGMRASDSAAHWTGSDVFFWGGHATNNNNDGRRWDPTTNTWSMQGTYHIIRRRFSSCATDDGIFVWGGLDHFGTFAYNDGQYFDYALNNWKSMASTTLIGRWRAKAFWTGRQVIVWGGRDMGIVSNYLNDGAVYNP